MKTVFNSMLRVRTSQGLDESLDRLRKEKHINVSKLVRNYLEKYISEDSQTK